MACVTIFWTVVILVVVFAVAIFAAGHQDG